MIRRQARNIALWCAGMGLLAGASAPVSAQSASVRQDAPDLLRMPEVRPIRGMSYPALAPDGKTLAFTYLGDLWKVPTEGGAATRLTVHEAFDAMPRWSPDGAWLAFTSLRNGNADIFLIPAQGGAARQVTFHSSSDWATDWSPDGKKLLFYSLRETRSPALYSIDLRTRALKQLTRDTESLLFGAWSPDGKRLAYTRSGEPWWRAWYRGSLAAHTVLRDLETGKVRTLLKTPTQQFWPLFAPDGKSVYVTMLYGEGNTPNLWRVPTDGGKPQPVTKYATDAVRYPTLARDGSRLAYLHEGYIHTIKPDGSGAKRVDILAPSDDKINNEVRATLTQNADESEPSPDGKQLALVARGELWLLPSRGGDAERLTDHPASDNDVLWSPDGAKLVFISDRDDQADVYTLDVKTKTLARITNDVESDSHPTFSPDGKWIAYAKSGAQPGLYLSPSGGGPARRVAEGNGNNDFGDGITSHAWSPDSRWIAFSRMDRTRTRDIWVVPAIGGPEINLTRYPGSNVAPEFTKDGRRLLFVSDRTGAGLLHMLPLEVEEDAPDSPDEKKALPDRSKDVKIDFEDIHLRARVITPPLGALGDFEATPDSKQVVVNLAGNFWIAPITGRGVGRQLTSSGERGSAIRFLPDGSRFFYIGANGAPRTLAVTGGPVSVVPFRAEYTFERRATFRQAYSEFFRRYGTAFYDAKMHGVDWNAVRRKYEAQLQGVSTPEEFARLLSMAVGEVNASHSEIGVARRGGGPQTASLGLVFDESHAGPGLKVASVLPKGPADKPSSRILPGEYILSIGGTDVALTEEYFRTLDDKAGKTVELLVNSKPEKDGARTIKIKPISYAQWRDLDYEAQVRKNRELVNKLSDNRLAYLHIESMDQPSLARFERELWSDAMGKDGLILDIRGNGGGNTHDAILTALSRRVYGYTQPRDGQRQSQPERAWTKPVILLVDQKSYSDAEVFPAGFRALKLGKIVGVTTPGYVIGTYRGQLVDGTSFSMPTYGFYTADGRNMELLGVAPDVPVENTPEDIAAGRDRQLETAVELILKEAGSRRNDLAGADRSPAVFSGITANPNGGSAAAPPRLNRKAP